MTSDSAAIAMGQGKMDLASTLRFIRKETHVMQELSHEEQQEIEELCTAVCAKKHQLHKVPLPKLREERFFYGSAVEVTPPSVVIGLRALLDMVAAVLYCPWAD